MKVCICELCGNQITFLNDAGVMPSCCGQEMTEIKANSIDASNEKHVPVIEVNGDVVIVKIGSVEHPMQEQHFIEYIVLETNLGKMRRILKPGDAPVATFRLVEGETVVGAYEHCNLHGLWKKVL